MKDSLSVMLNDLLNSGLYATASNSYPPINVYHQGDDIVLEMAVAGFKKSDISVEFDGQTLTVEGKKETKETSDRRWIYRELSSRAFTRKFALSGQYEPQSPTLIDGVLTVMLKGTNTKRKLEIIE